VSVDGRTHGALSAATEPAVPARPEPDFEILRAGHVEHAAAPTLRFRVAVRDPSGRPIYTIALSAILTVEPAKRRYSEAERGRLRELFGAPERWGATTESFRWAQTDALVPRFAGKTEFDLDIPCTYDHEVASAKYLSGLEGGEAPLRFHFNGSIFYETGDGRLQLAAIPWDCSVRFAMPVAAWRAMIDEHFPYRRWIALDPGTVERLAARRAERGLPTFDAVIDELLGEEG
jgi:hypothetical protein